MNDEFDQRLEEMQLDAADAEVPVDTELVSTTEDSDQTMTTKKATTRTRRRSSGKTKTEAKGKKSKTAKTTKTVKTTKKAPAVDKIAYTFLNIRVEKDVKDALDKRRKEDGVSYNTLVGPALRKLAGL